MTVTLTLAHSALVLASEPFSAYFSDAGTSGTVVVERLSDGRRWVHNSKRASKRFIPASTFKIAHALIALELGVTDLKEVIPWDGQVRRVKSWNRSQTLKQAMKNSAVPVFQQIAGRIGAERMQDRVQKLGYGNHVIGSQIDQFWLSGPLSISAMEQTSFLKKLINRALPLSKSVQSDVVGMLPVTSTMLGLVHGKTGWSISSTPAIGWYVGWLEAADDIYIFALNMDMTNDNHVPARKSILHQILSHILNENG